MQVNWTPLATIHLVGMSTLIGLAIFAARRRVRRSGPQFVLILLATALWLGGEGFSLIAVAPSTKIFLSMLKQVGIYAIGPLIFTVALQRIREPRGISSALELSLYGIPALSVIAAFTTQSHGWYWDNIRIVTVSGISRVVPEWGPLFWAATLYGAALVVAAMGLLIYGVVSGKGFRARELVVALPGIIIPFAAFSYFLSLAPDNRVLDPTPIAIGISIIIVAWGVLRLGVVNVANVASREIVDGLVDAVLVLDPMDYLIFCNPAAQHLLGISHSQVGYSAEEVLSGAPGVASFICTDGASNREVLLRVGNVEPLERWYDMELSPLRDVFGNESCRILVLRDIARHKAVERQIRALAYYDGLTGLPNRERFQQVLRQSLDLSRKHGYVTALLFLDLDRFKEVNDTLGHRAGDELLCEVARRIDSCVRHSDIVCRDDSPDEDGPERVSRFGGDEFTVLLSEIRQPEDAARVAARLIELLREPVEIDGFEVSIGVSIGIAIHPADGDDAETLLRNADTAMYVAKRRGSNEFEFYDGSMNARGIRRLGLEGGLRQALERDELALVYQPIRDARLGQLIAAEVLLLWTSPDWGCVSPDEFIIIAENTGMIHEIGAWVLDQCCAQLGDWNARGFAPIRLDVNISPHQLRRSGFCDMVEDALSNHGIDAAQLELELTESSIMGEDETSLVTLKHLDEMGLSLALDDFGTGYSSLSYLRRFPFSRVKIDRSFVCDLENSEGERAVAAAIIAMASKLNLKVVAEGIETEEQACILRELECDEFQGYLIGRPVSSEAFEEFLEREKPPD